MPLNEFKISWDFDGGVNIHMGNTYVEIAYELIPVLIKELEVGYATFGCANSWRMHAKSEQ